MNFKNLFFLCALIGVLAVACDDDDPEPETEEELITNMTVMLQGADGSSASLNFVDLDGDGGDAPVISGGTVNNGVTYLGTITLSNATETPPEDITAEIREEDDEHQFFFATSGDLDATVTYQDVDGNGNPLGLSFRMVPNATGTGNFTITLLHEPDKNAAGVSDGNPANAGGETDIEVAFPITVQ